MAIYSDPLKEKKIAIEEARAFLNSDENFNSKIHESLIGKLLKFDLFDYATEILLRKISVNEYVNSDDKLKDLQQLAIYVYKDDSLPSDVKFKEAFKILNQADDLKLTNNSESLGIAGAIYKRKWRFDRQFRNLDLSLYYYKKGFEKWKLFLKDNLDSFSNDNGFTAINYAYINELMAVDKLEQISKSSGCLDGISGNISEAQNSRQFILDQFIKDSDY